MEMNEYTYNKKGWKLINKANEIFINRFKKIKFTSIETGTPYKYW